jgi:hypothetical protein
MPTAGCPPLFLLKFKDLAILGSRLSLLEVGDEKSGVVERISDGFEGRSIVNDY